MSVRPSFRDFVADQLAPLGDVEIKRMFGGLGLYLEGKIFGLIFDDTVFLRVDDASRPDFVKRNMPALRPVRRDPSKVSENYYQLPIEALEDPASLLTWARRAVRASRSMTAGARRRAAKARPAKKVAPKVPRRRAR